MIAMVKTGKYEYILLNPAYVASSREVSLHEYVLFKDSLSKVLPQTVIRYFEICLKEKEELGLICCDVGSFERMLIDNKLKDLQKLKPKYPDGE